MKFSVNWLREFVDLPSRVEEVAEVLTLAGVEIEGIEQRGAPVDKVKVAQIKASAPHPNADRLSVCQVDDGSGQTRQIVCGAKNYQVGDKVFLASPGASLPNGTKIKESKLRGVESQGMLCSAIELGLGDDAAGLLILSPDARIGAPMSEIFSADTILDVEITPNRGDLLSHYGLAREIAALVGTPLRGVREIGSRPGGRETSLPGEKSGVKIAAPEQCPFFSLRRIEGVQVGPSPAWLRARLEAAGVRSINNVVDISNFVMLELGQPTHAFDADKLKGKIHVRLARAGEKFLALDGKTYSLTPHDLVIADDERAVGIAGVMGGEETGVTATTRNVLLEAAYFQPSSVRRTARTLNLPSDASYRFERGVDPMMILPASARASELMREIAQGKPAMEIATGGDLPANPADVSLGYAKCSQLMGTALASLKTDEILQSFGLMKSQSKETGAHWKIPSYRRDLQRDVDLIEEVVRAYGVQRIPGTDRSRFTSQSPADLAHDIESDLRGRLVGRGLAEARTSKLIPRKAAAFGENAIALRNPLSEDHVALRPNLLAGLLNVLERNVRTRAEQVAVFEIGRVFISPDAREVRCLGLLLWGDAAGPAHWRPANKRRLDFMDLKGAIESIAPAGTRFARGTHADLALATDIFVGQELIGFAGQLSGERASALDAPGGVFVAELNLDVLARAQSTARVFREIERFPGITRDIALIVPESVAHERIVQTIEHPREPLLERVELFDLFTGTSTNNLGSARKSLAYRLTYRDKTRTLTNEEVTAAHAKVRERLQSELGAELRE
jgi:phenylalanyl-tRNA synthetase beta chain